MNMELVSSYQEISEISFKASLMASVNIRCFPVNFAKFLVALLKIHDNVIFEVKGLIKVI